MSSTERSYFSWLVAAFLAVATLAVYSRFGSQARLLHDDAIFAYGGQQMVRGIPPYVSIFDHKGPLTTILCGIAAWLGELFGMDSLSAMRRMFLAIGVGSVLAVFGLARSLFHSTRTGLLAGAMFLAFARFGYHAISGPRPKTAVVLFESIALLCIVRRHWFAAGFSGALAGLVWQPTAVFAFAAVFLAGTMSEPGKKRKALTSAVLGMATPLLLTSGYFLWKGAFAEFFEGAVSFNLSYLSSPTSIRLHLFKIGEAIYEANIGLGFPITFGLLCIGLMLPWRSRGKGLANALLRDRFACLFVTLPWPILWSLADFQGQPDFWVFLPFAAVGFAWPLDRAMKGMQSDVDWAPGKSVALWLLAAFTLIGGGLYVGSYHRSVELPEQRSEVEALLASFDEDDPILFLGAPEALVLGERRNITRYGFMMRGIDALIEDTFEGGYDGWLDSLDRPAGAVVGRIVFRSIAPEPKAALEGWLEANYELDEDAPGQWLVYRRRVEISEVDPKHTQGSADLVR